MKYIDFLVKKVLSESLNEKAEELTKKILLEYDRELRHKKSTKII